MKSTTVKSTMKSTTATDASSKRHNRQHSKSVSFDAVVLHDFSQEIASLKTLCLREGDTVKVMELREKGWAIGRDGAGEIGAFPISFVKRLPSHPDLHTEMQVLENTVEQQLDAVEHVSQNSDEYHQHQREHVHEARRTPVQIHEAKSAHDTDEYFATQSTQNLPKTSSAFSFQFDDGVDLKARESRFQGFSLPFSPYYVLVSFVMISGVLVFAGAAAIAFFDGLQHIMVTIASLYIILAGLAMVINELASSSTEPVMEGRFRNTIVYGIMSVPMMLHLYTMPAGIAFCGMAILHGTKLREKLAYDGDNNDENKSSTTQFTA